MKKAKKIIIILLILWIAFCTYKNIKIPFFGQDYVVIFNDNKSILEDDDKEKVIKILKTHLNEKMTENIEITELAYKKYIKEGGHYYIFYTKNNEKNLYEHDCDDAAWCEECKTINKIVDKYYKWWQNNEKDVENSIEYQKADRFYWEE